MRDCGGYIIYKKHKSTGRRRTETDLCRLIFLTENEHASFLCLKFPENFELYIQNTKKRRLFHSEFNRQNDWKIQKVLVYVDFLQKSSPWICTYCQKWIDSKKKCIGRLTAGKKRANIQLSNETIHFQEAMDKLHRNYDLFLKTNKVSGRKFQVIQRRAYW